MDLPEAQQWYLRKSEDGTIFGPVSFEQLASWATEAQIAPHDSVSSDQSTWIKAPMLPQLRMDWLVEVTTERYYGPTTLNAIQEFINLGEVDGETYLINACDGTRCQVREIEGFQFPTLVTEEEAQALESHPRDEPAASGISIDLQDRIRDLEQCLFEERRAYEDLEEHYRELERRYLELEQRLTSLGSE